MNAERLDADDELASFRERFTLPTRADGRPAIYLCGNSLGPQPKSTRTEVEHLLAEWAARGVTGWESEDTDWCTYQERLRGDAAAVFGARPDEVVLMNSLTVNLHLMLFSFYRPSKERRKIIIDAPTFPSDLYALKSQIERHGFDPREELVFAGHPGEPRTVSDDEIEALIRERGAETALVFLNGVNYLTGQAFDLPRLVRAAREMGCTVGLDLAHAAGNMPVDLHGWETDFAVWCNYKYLNGGPGAVGGCFVHEKHAAGGKLPRLHGWWGNDLETRFVMGPDFDPAAGVYAWQISTPPLLLLACMKSSLAIFREAGMERIRRKSVALTGYLRNRLESLRSPKLEIVTPREPGSRGNQLSLLVHGDAEKLAETLVANGVICDFRRPNIIRVGPAPLYNTFREADAFVEIFEQQLRS